MARGDRQNSSGRPFLKAKITRGKGFLKRNSNERRILETKLEREAHSHRKPLASNPILGQDSSERLTLKAKLEREASPQHETRARGPFLKRNSSERIMLSPAALLPCGRVYFAPSAHRAWRKQPFHPLRPVVETACRWNGEAHSRRVREQQNRERETTDLRGAFARAPRGPRQQAPASASEG